MCTVPLDLQRRSEQRWAARLQRPAEPGATLEHRLKETDRQPAASSKTKRKTRPAKLTGLSSALPV